MFARIFAIGNLTRDLELRYTPQGTAVADFTLAVNKKYKGGENTSFLDFTVWDTQAENCAKYVGKGSKLMVEGEPLQERWEDKEGNKRSKIVFRANNVQFLDSKKSDTSDDSEPAADTDQAEVASAGTGSDVPF